MPPFIPEALVSALVALGVAAAPSFFSWLKERRGEEREDRKTTFEHAMDIAQDARESLAAYKAETEVHRMALEKRIRDLEEALSREREAHVQTLRTLRAQAEQIRELTESVAALTHERAALIRRLDERNDC